MIIRNQACFYFLLLLASLFATTAQASGPQFGKDVLNPDGSHTLLAISVEGHRVHLLVSDFTGVCKHFGYDEYVVALVAQLNEAVPLAVINDQGAFDGTELGRMVMQGVLCRKSGLVDSEPSTQAKKITVDDSGIATILEPRFDFLGREILIDAGKSDQHGVCHLFGFESAIDAKLAPAVESPRAIIGEDARMSDYWSGPGSIFKTLRCRSM